MNRILSIACLAVAFMILAPPAVQAQYVIEQAVNGGYNKYIKGQTFTPNVGINPDPGVVTILDLKEITFYRSSQGWSGPTSEFFLNIYDGDPVNGTGAFVGSSTNAVDVDPLVNLDPIPWTFDHLTLDYTHEYWALVSSTDTDGGLDVYCGMREGGNSPYAGGAAIGGNSGDPSGFLVKTTDLAFEIELDLSFPHDYTIEQTVNGGYNKYIKGQTFTPSVGIDPDPGTVSTVDLTAIRLYRSSQGWVGPTSEFYLNIYSGDPVNGTGVFIGSSTHSIDVAPLPNLAPMTWTFDHLILDYNHEYWALVSSTDTAGGLDVYCGMRECGPDNYAGGTAIGGNSGDPSGYLVKTNDLAFRIGLGVTDYPLTADTALMMESVSSTVHFALDAGTANAGKKYLLACSISGSEPGTMLPGGLVLPVNWDFTTDLCVHYNNIKWFYDFWGYLDVDGKAAPRFEWRPYPNSVGVVFTFAGCTAMPYDFVTNPWTVTIVP